MADSRFFHCEGPLTAGQIAQLVGEHAQAIAQSAIMA